MLKHGTRLLEPDVYVARVGARQAVFKDCRRYKWTPLAPLARLLVRHEARVLDRLSGWGYAPALLGTVGGLVLGMEFINGRVLGHDRSEEHTSELQSLMRISYAVFCLKKTT